MVKVNHTVKHVVQQGDDLIENNAVGYFTHLKKKVQYLAGGLVTQVKQVIQEVAIPLITSTICFVLETAMYDLSVGKIVAGVGYTACGGYLIAKSRAVRILSQMICAKPRLKKEIKISGVRIATALTGGALMTYGLYSIATGISELYHRARGEEIQALTGDQKIIFDITKKLKTCSQANKLWNRVEQDGPITIRLGTVNELQGSGGAFLIDKTGNRVIFIARDQSPDLRVRNLLMELCHARNNVGVTAVRKQAEAGNLSMFVYHREIIQIEWQSAKMHHSIAKECVLSPDWSREIDTYRYRFDNPQANWESFQEMWEDYLKDPEHLNQNQHKFYREQWLARFQEAYCKRHPNEVDCIKINLQ